MAAVVTRLLFAAVALVALSGCDAEAVIWWAFREHPPEVRAEAVEVATCESGLDERARNGQFVGLFQIGQRYHSARAERLGFSWERIATEGLPNAILAADLYSDTGDWRHWACDPR